MTELWFRNPSHYIREVIEAGERNIAFDYGYARKRKIDPLKFCKVYFGTKSFNLMIISSDGAQVFDENTDENTEMPRAVYPVWDSILDDMSLLEDIIANPVSENQRLLTDRSIPEKFRAIPGQKHVVVIHNIPTMIHGYGKAMIMHLRDLQKEYPECVIYIHGIYGYAPIINMGFGAFDAEPRTAAAHKKVWLPPGKEVKVETELHRHQKWVNLLGYSISELSVPRNRCIYTIKALRWAVINGTKDLAFAFVDNRELETDSTTPNSELIPQTTKSLMTKPIQPVPGDKVECNSCSLSVNCKLFREGSVCTLPESETRSLAEMIGTRDTDTILDAMARLAGMSVSRAEQGMAFETDFGIDPEVTKLFKTAFDQTERLAKLNDPRLRATINLQQTQKLPPAPEMSQLPDPRTAAKQAIAYWTELGLSPSEITKDKVREYILMIAAPKPIEGEVLDDDAQVQTGKTS